MTKGFDVLIFKRGRCSVYERKQSRIKMHFETPQALTTGTEWSIGSQAIFDPVLDQPELQET